MWESQVATVAPCRAMERLLAYPTTLPLVHVDHSHRLASPVPTGKCLGVHNANPIEAQFDVRISYLNDMVHSRLQKLHITEDYKLDQFECPSQGSFAAGNPTVSRRSANNIKNHVVEFAQKALGGSNAIAKITLAAEVGGEEFEIGSVVQAWKQFDLSGIKAHAVDTIKYMLTAYFNAPTGPVFYIRCNMQPM